MNALPPPPSPEPSLRAELRSVLHDLSGALLGGRSREYLEQSVRHALVLADLAKIESGVVRSLLNSLRVDLEQRSMDRPYYAQQLTLAADRL